MEELNLTDHLSDELACRPRQNNLKIADFGMARAGD